MNDNFISFLRFLQLVLVGLKATGYIEFCWTIVFVPVYVDFIVYLVSSLIKHLKWRKSLK